MTGINFVMDEHGEKTALLIDLQKLRQAGSSETDVMEFMEGLGRMTIFSCARRPRP